MKRVNPITAIALLLLRPKEFVRQSVLHDVALALETNAQLLAAYPNRVLPPEQVAQFEATACYRTRKIRAALFLGLSSTLFAIVLGAIAGIGLRAALGKPGDVTVVILQVTSAGIILVATLALLGWEIQSYKGQSLPEKVNQWIFRAQYWFGTFLFVASVAWTV
jgi:hypothetical protein